MLHGSEVDEFDMSNPKLTNYRRFVVFIFSMLNGYLSSSPARVPLLDVQKKSRVPKTFWEFESCNLSRAMKKWGCWWRTLCGFFVVRKPPRPPNKERIAQLQGYATFSLFPEVTFLAFCGYWRHGEAGLVSVFCYCPLPKVYWCVSARGFRLYEDSRS